MACAADMETLLAARRDEIAAVIMEPRVQGAAGMIVHPEGFLRRVADSCRRNGVLLILDEVATGLGRTGTMFACEKEGVSPDFLCLAKGLSGGYLPLGATLTTESVYRSFLGDFGSLRTFYHGHTYTGNPLACAAAVANLDVFAAERTLEHVQERASELARLLEPLRVLDRVGDVRQEGLMAGIELVRDKTSREPYPYAEKWGYRVTDACRGRGVILRPLGNVVVVMPTLAISAEQLARVVSALHRAIREVTA
jgi:adenosylmethionine-8-amino-7-oxononanoate aminotransferase